MDLNILNYGTVHVKNIFLYFNIAYILFIFKHNFVSLNILISQKRPSPLELPVPSKARL